MLVGNIYIKLHLVAPMVASILVVIDWSKLGAGDAVDETVKLAIVN